MLGFLCLEKRVWRFYPEVKVHIVARSVGPIYGENEVSTMSI